VAEKTKIAWCHHSFNIAWGCTEVGPECDNCYARVFAERKGFRIWGPAAQRRTFGDKHWREPLGWNRKAAEAKERRRVFCSSMADVFENHRTVIQQLPRLWELIRATPWLEWLLLTKRANRIAKSLPPDWGPGGYHNVWLGVSCGLEKSLWRVDALRSIPAVVRFVSYEPALGPLAHAINLDGIDQVIYGGESGPGYRPEDKQWARDMKKLCRSHKPRVAFFHKQSAHFYTERGIELDGKIVREYPKPRIVPLTLGAT
jgi:protein gp37